MFPRHHRTKKTTTPWWNNGRYLANVLLNSIGRYDPVPRMCRAFYRHLSLGNIQPLLRRFRGIDDGKMPSRERPGKTRKETTNRGWKLLLRGKVVRLRPISLYILRMINAAAAVPDTSSTASREWR